MPIAHRHPTARWGPVKSPASPVRQQGYPSGKFPRLCARSAAVNSPLVKPLNRSWRADRLPVQSTVPAHWGQAGPPARTVGQLVALGSRWLAEPMRCSPTPRQTDLEGVDLAGSTGWPPWSARRKWFELGWPQVALLLPEGDWPEPLLRLPTRRGLFSATRSGLRGYRGVCSALSAKPHRSRLAPRPTRYCVPKREGRSNRLPKSLPQAISYRRSLKPLCHQRVVAGRPLPIQRPARPPLPRNPIGGNFSF